MFKDLTILVLSAFVFGIVINSPMEILLKILIDISIVVLVFALFYPKYFHRTKSKKAEKKEIRQITLAELKKIIDERREDKDIHEPELVVQEPQPVEQPTNNDINQQKTVAKEIENPQPGKRCRSG